MFNHHKGQHFNIVFKASKKEVIVDVEYQELDSDLANQPEYRNSILKWQDQIELLNAVKGYAIQNSTQTITNGKEQFRKTTLTLPNLI